MKISYNWLKEYVDFDLSPEALSEVLTDIGLEVEGCEQKDEIKGGLAGVVIGEVIEVNQHPNADRLKTTKVNIGDQLLPIVCGAPNVAEGQKVAVATVGCEIFPNGGEGLKIKKAKIRGEESMGMICAEDELGLGQSHDGIMILDVNTQIGLAASDYFNLQSDYQIEIGLTPNRADAMGHMGVARDLKAYLNVNGSSVQVKKPQITDVQEGNSAVKIEIQDAEGCPKYLGVVIENITMSESPAWLKTKLRSIGLSPINVVVDVTNFVMHETGQPLHAFDNDIIGGKVIVRKANSGEKFVTLDELERTLNEEDLVICNEDSVMCLAGVFGGIHSGVSEKTTSIFLESAWFDPVTIRKGAKRHGLHTDASFRFERGVDPNMTEFAMKRAVNLLIELTGANLQGGYVKAQSREFEPSVISFSAAKCNALIGEKIDDSYIRKVLTELDIEIEMQGDEWELKVPPYRVDVKRQSDVIEEILRIYGYNKVTIPTKVNATMAQFPQKDIQACRNQAADFLAAQGFTQIMNNSLTSKKYYNESEQSRLVEILNPLSQELNVMRSTLMYGGLEVIAHNQNRQHPDVKLFEFGSHYNKLDIGYSENEKLMLLTSGQINKDNWHGNKTHTFYEIKSYVFGLLAKFGLVPELSAKENEDLADGIQLKVNTKMLAEIGWVKTPLLKQFGIKQAVYYAEIDWKTLFKAFKIKIQYQEVSKFPEVKRDLSLLLDENVSFRDVQQVIRSVDKKLIRSIDLFDVYEGKNIETGKKSYAVGLILQDHKTTLIDKQVDQLMDKIINSLSEKLGATLR